MKYDDDSERMIKQLSKEITVFCENTMSIKEKFDFIEYELRLRFVPKRFLTKISQEIDNG